MTKVKYVSTRVSIIGRGASCKGMSAVERSAYISRSTLHSDYYGQTFYPKYAEDLVYGEVLLPDHAPEAFKDRATLWNSVEQQEKHAKAQLCRSVNISMPNEWSYELSVEAVREYIRRNFTGKGMCAEYAIHDSVNPKTHQRNLHCHILLTMRPLNQDGSWGERQTKVYKLDKAGDRIRNRNGKGWQCTTVKTTDWDAPDNARRWRKNLAEEINVVNERIGLTDVVWEWRSFKEQGIEEKPTIHLGEKASALENSGISTERGEYNRDVRQFNALLRQEKLLLEQERLETENSIVADKLSVEHGFS